MHRGSRPTEVILGFENAQILIINAREKYNVNKLRYMFSTTSKWSSGKNFRLCNAP
jgi:hypothetical protein